MKRRGAYVDKDNIRMVGDVDLESADVTFYFGDEKISIEKQLGTTLERAIVEKSMLSSITEWKEKKKSVYEGKTNYSEPTSYIGAYSRNSKHASCIYCGAAIASGSACERCLGLYQKKRRGFGGYPFYDPNAQGSNGVV